MNRCSITKSLVLTVCLLALDGAAFGAESRAAGSIPPSSPSSTNQEDKPFCDPFAPENTQAQAKPKVSDPLEGMNRAFFNFNDRFYFWFLRPAAQGYSKVAPQPARVCFGRFFANVQYPVRLLNNLLEGKFENAGVETGRFLINSTVGVAGLFDSAAGWKPQGPPADFDQTLGFYGVRPGMYFDWPLLGPSSARGTAGLLADGALAPWSYIDGFGVSIGVPAFNILNSTSLRLGEYESFKKATLDPYVAMRSAYLENRANAVRKSKE
jgi:phospholipid-binding lipoprotein MlaA